MKGIAESMLVLIVLGGLVVFLGMQVLGYGVPLDSGDGINQDSLITDPEVIKEDQVIDSNQRMDNMESFEEQLSRREADIAAEEYRLKQEFAQLEERQVVLDAQQAEIDAARQELALENEQIYAAREEIAKVRLELEQSREVLTLKEEQIEIKRNELDVEASRQAVVSSLLREWAVSLETEQAQVFQMKEHLTTVRWISYALIFCIGVFTLIYHLIILRILWVRGLIKKPLIYRSPGKTRKKIDRAGRLKQFHRTYPLQKALD